MGKRSRRKNPHFVANKPKTRIDEESLKHPIRKLPEKEFKLRNSLLTDLFDNNPHVQTIYHISIAAFICWFVNTLGHDYYKDRRIVLGTNIIGQAFGKINIALCIWILFTMGAIMIYFCFRIWVEIRVFTLPPRSIAVNMWDTISLCGWVVYYMSSFILATSFTFTYQLPIGSAAIICIEQIRYLMKIHSFLRYNCGPILNYKTHSDRKLKLPPFSNYFYFLFAPTLLYRNAYPRTDGIRWKFVLTRLVECVLVIFTLSFTVEKIVYPSLLQDTGKLIPKYEEIVLTFLRNSGPGLLIYILGFYLVLHVVQNLFAELLRFGDRVFYEDWWTSTGFLSFFRTWNIVVSDWLYTYIYKDVYEFVLPNRAFAKLAVFVISATVHEWILFSIFGFLFPVLFIEMLFSGCLALFPSPKSNTLNVILWYGLMLGNGINVSLYGLEYVIRSKLPLKSQGTYDYLYPLLLFM